MTCNLLPSLHPNPDLSCHVCLMIYCDFFRHIRSPTFVAFLMWHLLPSPFLPYTFPTEYLPPAPVILIDLLQLECVTGHRCAVFSGQDYPFLTQGGRPTGSPAKANNMPKFSQATLEVAEQRPIQQKLRQRAVCSIRVTYLSFVVLLVPSKKQQDPNPRKTEG